MLRCLQFVIKVYSYRDIDSCTITVQLCHPSHTYFIFLWIAFQIDFIFKIMENINIIPKSKQVTFKEIEILFPFLFIFFYHA